MEQRVLSVHEALGSILRTREKKYLTKVGMSHPAVEGRPPVVGHRATQIQTGK